MCNVLWVSSLHNRNRKLFSSALRQLWQNKKINNKRVFEIYRSFQRWISRESSITYASVCCFNNSHRKIGNTEMTTDVKDIDCVSAQRLLLWRMFISKPPPPATNSSPQPPLARQHVLVICKQLMLISWVMTPCDLGCRQVLKTHILQLALWRLAIRLYGAIRGVMWKV